MMQRDTCTRRRGSISFPCVVWFASVAAAGATLLAGAAACPPTMVIQSNAIRDRFNQYAGRHLMRIDFLALTLTISFVSPAAAATVIDLEPGETTTLVSAEEAGEDVFFTGNFNVGEIGGELEFTLEDPNDAFGVLNLTIGVAPLESNLIAWRIRTFSFTDDGEEVRLNTSPLYDILGPLQNPYTLDFSDFKTQRLEIFVSGNGFDPGVDDDAFLTIDGFDPYTSAGGGGGGGGGGADPGVIPLPAPAWLLLGGLGALVGLRRLRRSSA